MENKSLIKLNDVTVKFKEHLVLDKVCMEFESGKIYGIIGRNGSGKTVLLKCPFFRKYLVICIYKIYSFLFATARAVKKVACF